MSRHSRIETKILLRAPLSRVWRALSDSTEFGLWFGMRFSAPFTPGAVMRGHMVPTIANPEVAAAQKQYEGTPFQGEITIQEIEPERLFSFRWHPGAVDPSIDYSTEPTTLVVFALEEVAGGVMLTVTESGFDAIPLARRAAAFNQNEQGWTMVVENVRGVHRQCAVVLRPSASPALRCVGRRGSSPPRRAALSREGPSLPSPVLTAGSPASPARPSPSTFA